MKLLLGAMLMLTWIPSQSATIQDDAITDSLLAKISTHGAADSLVDYAAKEKALREEIIKNPHHLLPRLKISRIFLMQGKTSQANAFLRKGVYYNQDDWRGWFWLGTGHLMSRNFKYASKFMEAAIKKSSGAVLPLVQKSIILQEMGNWKGSIAYLMAAIKKSPDNPVILLNIGYSAEMSSNMELMHDAYTRFIRVTDGNDKYIALRSIVKNSL